ncbi:hypothetical protein D1970_09250 [Mesobacillus zeae]|uniref:Spore germination protein n=2 Tax=Mesobacillus zeae TaxID=1917180 RepID=A0A398BE98_9BACI|nr:hypothetical protein D1970_09250 [Mesobacillus zeae]
MNQNANIDFGTTTQNSHTSNVKVVGASVSFGDSSPVTSKMMNVNREQNKFQSDDHE